MFLSLRVFPVDLPLGGKNLVLLPFWGGGGGMSTWVFVNRELA